MLRPRTLAAPSWRGAAARLRPSGAAGKTVADLGREARPALAAWDRPRAAGWAGESATGLDLTPTGRAGGGSSLPNPRSEEAGDRKSPAVSEATEDMEPLLDRCPQGREPDPPEGGEASHPGAAAASRGGMTAAGGGGGGGTAKTAGGGAGAPAGNTILLQSASEAPEALMAALQNWPTCPVWPQRKQRRRCWSEKTKSLSARCPPSSSMSMK